MLKRRTSQTDLCKDTDGNPGGGEAGELVRLTYARILMVTQGGAEELVRQTYARILMVTQGEQRTFQQFQHQYLISHTYVHQIVTKSSNY